MKKILFFSLIIIANWILSFFLPWWNIALICFALSYLFRLGNLTSFWLAFLSVFIFWTGLSAFLDLQNDQLIGGKLTKMLSIQSVYVAYLLTGVIGALVGSFSAAAGNALNELLSSKKNRANSQATPMKTEDLDDLRPEWKDKTHI
jgi:hypothetical protein